MIESLLIKQYKDRYDECAKRIMANKYILAFLLKKLIVDFKTYDIEDIIPYLDNDIKISEVDEEMICYDLLFYVTSPITYQKMLINIEIQQGLNSHYKMCNRELYYTSRMVSSQKNREFIKQNYDHIIKIHSIWLLLFMDDYFIQIQKFQPIVLSGKTKLKSNDISNIYEVGLGKGNIPKDEYYDLYYLLDLVFRSKLNSKEKIAILDDKYGILFNEEGRKDVNDMCNASLGLIRTSFEDGLNEGIAAERKRNEAQNKQTIINLHNLNLSIEDIATCMNRSVEEVQAIINEALN